MAETNLQVKTFFGAVDSAINEWLASTQDIGEIVSVSLAATADQWRYVILYKSLTKNVAAMGAARAAFDARGERAR
jgi:hypothetical protein